jgi:NTE family protein
MASRLPVHEWNLERKLIINAVDAETGEWVKFDQNSGVPLLLAVSASSAVPGIYPPTTINNRRYIDGGMSSGTNADTAQGYDRVLIIVAEPSMIAPAMGPTMHRITFQEELSQLKAAGSQVMVISPNEESLEAKGPNPLDANFRGVSAQAGHKQGQKIAGEVKVFLESAG